MKPAYQTLKSHHYSSDYNSSSYVSAENLYEEMGYKLADLLKQNPGYANTCAARMSLALLKSGVNFSGRLKIKAGDHAGKMMEPGAKLLADQLAKPGVFGVPETFSNPATAQAKLAGKKGVVLFWKIDGYGGGHIDLIESSNSALLCNSHCYFSCKEVWFWSLA
jgi:Type VI secretion system (T6SS), amidase effector protein 4